MNARSGFDPFGSEDTMVDQNIGSAYRHVRHVARNMAAVKKLADGFPDGGVIPNIGQQGLGISTAKIDSSGHLIITRTDGSKIDAGMMPYFGTGQAGTPPPALSNILDDNDERPLNQIEGGVEALDQLDLDLQRLGF